MRAFRCSLVFAVTAVAAFPGLLTNFRLHRRQTECSKEEIGTCFSASKNVDTTYNIVFKIDNSSVLDEQCRLQSDLLTCINRAAENCSEPDKIFGVMQIVVENILDHVCSQTGREILLAEMDCWQKEEFEAESTQCAARREGDQEQPCKFYKRVQNCITTAASTHCSPRATNFMNNLVYYTLEPFTTAYLTCEDADKLTLSGNR